MSNLLKEKHALTSLRAKLEGKQARVCWKYRGFRHQAQHCRRREEKKGKLIPQNKFEILANRVVRYGVELRRQEAKQEKWKVEYYKCGEEGHKYKKCLLWRRKEPVERKLVHPVKEKAQKTERKTRKTEEDKAACVAKP